MNVDDKNILAIDAGTSSMRCILFDRQGKVLFVSQQKYAPTCFPDGRVEQDPESWYQAMSATMSEAAAEAHARHLTVSAVSLASQRSSVMAADISGHPLTPCFMWHDNRSAAICGRLRSDERLLYDRTGLRLTPMFSAPKMAWIRENLPSVYCQTFKFLGVHEFLLHKLTGDFVTDRSTASRSLLLNLRTGEWDEQCAGIFAVGLDKLCRLVDAGAVCGHLTDAMAARCGLPAGIPVVAAGGDQQCGVLGLGVMENGMISTTVGTGAFTIGLSDKPVLDPQMRILCNISAQPGHYIAESPLLTAGNVYQWFAGQFMDSPTSEGRLAQADNLARQSTPGSGGLRMMPYLTGRGAPNWNPDARGAFLNVSLDSKKSDFVRAILEAIALEISDNLGFVRGSLIRSGILIPVQVPESSDMLLSGGLAKMTEFNQMIADASGCSVIVRENTEATALGAWAGAAAAIGLFPDSRSAVASALAGQNEARYVPDPSRKAIYDFIGSELQQYYRKIYPV
ncbi:MAG: xylulokinase, partial [Saccharofermentanales bacterium]